MSRQTIAYQPALDGTRALAVTAVLLFHGGISWMSGGYVGVSVFFTLSGYLITSLLLAEQGATGRVDARSFYTRRARRLLPASVVCLVGIVVLAGLGWFDGVANLRRDVLGALFQVFNWVKLGSGESYADLTTAAAGLKNPLDHYWSLAIEEQFYWVWPLAFVGLLALGRRFGVRPVVIVGALTALSAVAAPVIATVWGPDAAYWATPARICEILAGAFVACWLFGRSASGAAARWGAGSARLAVLAPVALVALAVTCVLFPEGSGPAYEGALPLVAALSAALIVGLQTAGPVRSALSVAPLVFLGKISYGVYLYHWPVFVLIDRENLTWPVGATLLLKCSITLAISLVSYYAIERPIRTAQWLPPRRTLVGAFAGTALAAMLAIVVIPATDKYYGVDEAAAEQVAIPTGPVESLVPLTSATVAPTTEPVVATPDSLPVETSMVTTTTERVTFTLTQLPVPSRPVRILVVGDSTAEATGAGVVAWAAANPQYAQVSLATGPGCGLVLGGYIPLTDRVRDVTAECGPYVVDGIAERVTTLQPDVVMVMTTVWDVLDRQLVVDGPPLAPTDPAVEALMLQSLGEFTDHLLALGVPRVVWVQSPSPLPSLAGGEDQQAQPQRHEVLHRVISEVATTRPAVRVAELSEWLIGGPLADSREARTDGVHWTSDASLIIASDFLGPLLVQAALT